MSYTDEELRYFESWNNRPPGWPHTDPDWARKQRRSINRSFAVGMTLSGLLFALAIVQALVLLGVIRP